MSRLTPEEGCPSSVSDHTGFHFRRCGRKPISDRGFCGIHDPERIAERKAKRGPTQFERELEGIRSRAEEIDELRATIRALEQERDALAERAVRIALPQILSDADHAQVCRNIVASVRAELAVEKEKRDAETRTD